MGGRGAARVRHPGAAPARAARGPGGPCIRRRPPPRWSSVRTVCSATWRTCRSSPSSRGRSAGASRCAPGRRNCPQGARRLAPTPTPARPLPEAARDPLGVLLAPQSSSSPRPPCYPNPALLGPPSSTWLGFSQPGPPGPRDGHPEPARDPSDALGFLVPRPSPPRALSPTRPSGTAGRAPVVRASPASSPAPSLSHSRSPSVAVLLPPALQELPLAAAARLSRLLSLGLPLPPLWLPGAAARVQAPVPLLSLHGPDSSPTSPRDTPDPIPLLPHQSELRSPSTQVSPGLPSPPN